MKVPAFNPGRSKSVAPQSAPQMVTCRVCGLMKAPYRCRACGKVVTDLCKRDHDREKHGGALR